MTVSFGLKHGNGQVTVCSGPYFGSDRTIAIRTSEDAEFVYLTMEEAARLIEQLLDYGVGRTFRWEAK